MPINKLKFLLIICLVGLSSSAFSDNFYSLPSGNGVWTTVGNWSNTLNGPSNGTTPSYSAMSGQDNVRILSNITLTGNLTVSTNSQLRVFAGTTLTINGTADFQNGSYVTVDSGAVLTINGNLNNSNNSSGIVVNGTINVNGNVTGGNGSSIVSTNGNNGALNVTGTVTLNGTGTVWGSIADCTVSPCNSTASSPLPVTLIYFRGVQIGSSVKLDWATASEINNDYFAIEKSANGIMFEEAGKTHGAGNSTSTIYYSFSDARPKTGVTYYRLKQVDYDGTTTYSKTIAVNLHTTDFDLQSSHANYSNESITVTVNSSYQGKAEYRFTDMLGNIIVSGSLELETGNKEVTVSANRLAQGVYYFTIRNEREAITKKIFY
jgi:hypothetical protein